MPGDHDEGLVISDVLQSRMRREGVDKARQTGDDPVYRHTLSASRIAEAETLDLQTHRVWAVEKNRRDILDTKLAEEYR